MAPSTSLVPDYYDLVDPKDVITFPSLKKRQHCSRQALLADVDQMAQNCAVYNTGAMVPNPDFVKGSQQPEMIRKGPGKHGLSNLVPTMRAVQKRIRELLNGRYRNQVLHLTISVGGAVIF